MTGLLDYIFNNLEERNLDRAQKYQAIKLKLLSRMQALNQEQLKFYSKNQDGPESNDEKE